MGRDDSVGKGTNKQSLPLTPKNLKIPPNKVKEEFAKELEALHELAKKSPVNKALSTKKDNKFT